MEKGDDIDRNKLKEIRYLHDCYGSDKEFFSN